jgi:hypothetical protein
VVEVIKDFRGDTFRAVYTLRCAGPAGVVDKLRKMLAFLLLPEVLKVASELTDSYHAAA